MLGSKPVERPNRAGTFALTTGRGPYISGGEIPLGIEGTGVKPTFTLIGPGSIVEGVYRTPVLREPVVATIIATTSAGVAVQDLQLVPAPSPARALIAVATYYGGVALHSASDFSLVGIVTAHGAPGDVAFDAAGDIYAPLTNGPALLVISREPWETHALADVPLGNEVVYDRTDASIFVSNRDVGNGKGGLTKISAGKLRTIITGMTAEGLALDELHHRIYVGNVNDNSIVEVDTRSLQIRRRINSVPRTFGIALDAAGNRIFVASNQNKNMRRGGGYVSSIDLKPAHGAYRARSRNLPFPVGVAFDARTSTVFATDEDTGVVYVLDAKTLRDRHAPLRACAVPWRPKLDVRRRRLYVPCAHANAVAIFNVDTLRAVRGSPIATANYPLGVAVSDE